MNKSRVQFIGTAVAMGLVVAAIATANWSAPLSSPPTCNTGDPGCDPAINVTTNPQTKGGGLTILNNFIAATNASTRVGIGTAAPSASYKLDVIGGNVRAPDFCLNGGTGLCMSQIGAIASGGVQSIIQGLGISITSTGPGGTGNVTVTNAGVRSAIGSAGIGVSGATGNVTFTNTGVTRITASGNITASGPTGNVTLTVPAPPLVSPESSLRIVRGGVYGGGGCRYGAGFTCPASSAADLTAGVTRVWFDPPFSGQPAVVATVFGGNGNITVVGTADYASFSGNNSDGTQNVKNFDFIAIGPN